MGYDELEGHEILQFGNIKSFLLIITEININKTNANETDTVTQKISYNMSDISETIFRYCRYSIVLLLSV